MLMLKICLRLFLLFTEQEKIKDIPCCVSYSKKVSYWRFDRLENQYNRFIVVVAS
jgi:hypothetical protein